MQQFGVIGLSVMGKNLALNAKNHGFSVAGYSIDKPEVDALAKYEDKDLKPTYTLEDFVNSLERPRKILVQIMAGAPVDEVIQRLIPLLDKGDIIIDGGNSNFHDTVRRSRELESKGIHFIGMGVSGGEEGALNGPALMPGGDEEAYKEVAPILEAMAAKTPTGQACVGYIGPEGSGHYVKMVHNGIEYGIMQIIVEVYDILRTIGKYSNEEMSDIFAKWDESALKSYLIEITAKVLKQKDDLTSGYVVDHILNEASYKGTGNWMLEDAIKLGVPITVIAEAVMARFMSKATFRDDPELATVPEKAPKDLVEKLGKALYLATAVSYAQGFEQMTAAAKTYSWGLHYDTIAQNWEAGCIIRSEMLQDIKSAYRADENLQNLFKAPFFDKVKKEDIGALRDIIKLATDAGIPTPTLSAALNYLESIFNPNLPQNLLQAQRDYFGAHTYQRNDRPGTFHTEWYEEK
ncbi:NADP-dependent phosphogluconate dehydrogenase [Lactobacillus sp. PV034]|uniref:NADP-dependent phosphogluconate dehydrogenase n=1 Tax=Lactobacillus sp. PV034 TaxID=2594495 RepID=UPI002240AEB0|nr:NADP-dependent phosphogluconate dehydrogenase [Lactobacillus sp. PV034]QNQ81163.1 NADP-dependent phosphogluconate dehydrogenase [Lactobacillus sp. PV034]